MEKPLDLRLWRYDALPRYSTFAEYRQHYDYSYFVPASELQNITKLRLGKRNGKSTDRPKERLMVDHFSLPFPNVDLLVSRPLAGGFIGNR